MHIFSGYKTNLYLQVFFVRKENFSFLQKKFQLSIDVLENFLPVYFLVYFHCLLLKLLHLLIVNI